MANPKLLWVRDAIQAQQDIGDQNDQVGFVDLLWKARWGENAQTGVTLLEQGEPRASDPGELPVQDLTGAIVERIRLQGVYTLAPIPNLVTSIDQTNLGRITSAGTYEGILVAENVGTLAYGNLPTDTIGDFGQLLAPGDKRSSVTQDWLWWNRRYVHGEDVSRALQPETVDAGQSVYTIGFSIDTRCSRKLLEWGDTLLFCYHASTGETVNQVSFAWSVLLRRPG